MKWAYFLLVFQRVNIQKILWLGEDLVPEKPQSPLLLVPACVYAKHTQALKEMLLAFGRENAFSEGQLPEINIFLKPFVFIFFGSL